MGILEFINEVVFASIEGLVILLFFIFLVDKKDFIDHNKFKTFVYIVFYTVFSYWATAYIAPGIHTVCYALFVITLLSFITQSNIFNSTIALVALAIFILITEVFVLLAGMIIYDTNMSELATDPASRLAIQVSTKSMQLVILVFLQKSRLKSFRINLFKKENSPIVAILFQVFTLGVIFLSINYASSSTKNIVLYNIFILIIYLLFIILNFFDLKEREKMLKIKSKLSVQEEYVKNVEVVMDIIRREKHDFTNHLNTIYALCTLNKPDATEKIGNYIRQLTNSLNSSYRFFNSHNDYIDVLLAVKSNYAYEHDIHLEADFKTPLNRVRVDNSDLISVIGNIIDNAFDAHISYDSLGKKLVSIMSYSNDKSCYISISNNGPKISPGSLNSIFESGYSTKTCNKPDHGFGLYIASQLVNRNGGEISVNSSNEETEFLIKFKLLQGAQATA